MMRLLWTSMLVMLLAVCSMADDVRVMSFNIRYGTAQDGENHWDNRRQFVAETIAAYDPDLLGTQETLGFQKVFLTDKLPGYTAIGVGRDDGGDTGEVTPVFFKTERFEKLDNGHFWLSETPDLKGSISWDSSLTRMASWVRLKDRRGEKNRPILFINTHFDHKGKEARRQSAALIRRLAGSIGDGCDIVLTGDFNAAVDSPPYRTLFDSSLRRLDGLDSPRPPVFNDTYANAKSADAAGEATFSSFRGGVIEGSRIDWIATAGNWDILSAAIDRTARDGRSPSDHYPVTATLRQTSPKPTPLRVISYNIKRGLGNDDNTDLLRSAYRVDQYAPDFVGLQEVDNGAKRSGNVDQAAELGKRLQMQHAFGPFMDFQGGRYGLALLSRYSIDQINVVPLPKGNEPRVALAATIKLPTGQTVVVVNVHFDWVADDGFRFAQAVALRKYLDALAHPYLLMGDFNDVPESRTVKLLSAGAAEAKKPADDRFTFSSTRPKIEIDFIFGFPASMWRFENVRVIDDPLTSDHRPVYVEAWLNR